MSRAPIPSLKKCEREVPLKIYVHVAIVAFRRDFLLRFGTLPMTALERIESVDYLRIVENGYRMKMVLTDAQAETVDTPRDLQRVEELMRGDPLISTYSKAATQV
jgi:3-deoxy-manno-octulosonate cytidylyltransferase (CMP-KDO synthetase)